MIATLSPRVTSNCVSPIANARTWSRTRDQVQVCQIPRSFSRIAGSSRRRSAFLRRNLDKVSDTTGASAPWDRVLPTMHSVLPNKHIPSDCGYCAILWTECLDVPSYPAFPCGGKRLDELSA